MAVLEAEWTDLQDHFHDDVEAWHDAMAVAASEYIGIREAGRWLRGRSDLFGVARISRNELAHSAVIAWLLDPEGRHGFGRAFVDRVITEHLPELDPRQLRIRSIQLEVQRSETRADIVVWGDTGTIVIETKVDAEEGWNQCDRIFERFSMDVGPHFLFLTPSGREPITATGPAREAFRSFSFAELADHLEVVLHTHNEGEAVDVARNYLRTLRAEFS